jgi:hypothetical protein
VVRVGSDPSVLIIPGKARKRSITGLALADEVTRSKSPIVSSRRRKLPATAICSRPMQPYIWLSSASAEIRASA